MTLMITTTQKHKCYRRSSTGGCIGSKSTAATVAVEMNSVFSSISLGLMNGTYREKCAKCRVRHAASRFGGQ